MPSSGYHRPPAPTCEDAVDEDTQSLLTDNRAPANVAVKRTKSSEFDAKSGVDKKSNDGSDSGYSSKAGNSDIMPTATPKKGGDLKINTKPIEIERERQPYVYAPTRPDGSQSSPTKTKAVKMEKMARQPADFQHPHGICWVCDKFGYHFDPEKEIHRPATTAPTHTQKVDKSPAPKSRSKDESDVRPSTSRRSSSSRPSARPTSMYVTPTGYGFPYQMDFAQAMFASSGYQTPPQHMAQPAPQYPPHYPYGYPPPTPGSATPYTPHPGVFDMSPLQYALPLESFYEHPAHNTYIESNGMSKTSNPESGLQRATSRARSGTQRSKKSETEKIPIDKLTMDRQSMPPPPRPERVRPVIQKSPTDYPHYASSRRRSVFEEDDERAEFQAIVARERNSSHSRPPSSYKAPAGAEIQGRPQARKSSSYSTPSGTVHVASSREMPRRKTDTTAQRVADAEAYLERSRKPKEPEFEEFVSKYNREPVPAYLTPDALKRLDQRHSAAISEAGSARSKHSSSRDSGAGRTRAGTAVTSNPTANITMPDGFSFCIPADYNEAIDIKVGNFRLSMNPAQEELYHQRELRQIERAPSEASHTSRRSLTNSSGVSLTKSREDTLVRTKSGANSSKRASRATSGSRPENNRGSIDYSIPDEYESYYRDYGA